MYRKTDDFVSDWGYESQSTLKVLRNLTDESLAFRAGPGVRSIGRLAWHIAQTLPEMMGQAGLFGLEGAGEGEPVPATAQEIVEAYERGARSVSAAVAEQWSDGVLEGKVPRYRHEAHHRGQLTALMRLAGLAVPGCYGPTAEEWAAMGMAAAE
jgi:uncharacterized damage-inducible protein DinB